MRLPLALALLGLLTLAPLAAAGPVATVAPSDALAGKTLSFLDAGLGYLDANANAHPDAATPQEPVYLDLDGNHQVSYGDLRLSAFLGYPAGAVVDLANRDVGRPLAAVPGWFATAGSAWFVDVDGSATVSIGDVRLDPFGAQVAAGDAALGTPLQAAQQQTNADRRVGYVDGDGDRHRAALDPVVLDLDPTASAGSGKVSTGDLMVTPAGLAADDSVTHAEMQAAIQAGIQSALQQAGVAKDSSTGAYKAPPAWGPPELILLVLGLLNLAGLAYVMRQRRGPPRNPFK